MSWNWIAGRMNKFTVGYWLWFTNFFAIFAIYEVHVRHTPTIRLVLGICSLTALILRHFSQSWPLVQLRWMVPLTIFFKKTRWSPRTRMLTRMLMVQMSKHMVMQSRTIPFCNSLFEQSCACFTCYQSAVRSGKCRVWSVECEVRSVQCKVWSGECRVCNV